jgi:type VI secretion system protein ImpM
MASPGVAGCFGKLRGNGDFVTRRLPMDFVEPWDAMLQSGLIAVRATLGPAWLHAYLTAPLWRFALGGGVLGESGWAGVLMPSVDSVGRYFPLTIAAPVEAGAWPISLLCAQGWFGRAESLALATLADDARLVDFDAGLVALSDVDGAADVIPPSYVGSSGTCDWWHAGAMRTSFGLPDPEFVAGFLGGAPN